MAGNEEVRRAGKGHEGAFIAQWVVTKLLEVESAVGFAAVVIFEVEVCEYGLFKVFPEEIDRMYFPNSHEFEDFAGTIAHASPTCERHLGSRGQFDLGKVGLHLRAVFAIDGARQVVSPVLCAKRAKRIVCPHHSSISAKTNDAPSARSLEQLVIDETDALVQASAQQLGVVGLKLESVRKEEVGLVGNQLIDGNLFDPKEHVAIAEVFAELNTGSDKLGIGNSPDIAGLDDQFHIGKPF